MIPEEENRISHIFPVEELRRRIENLGSSISWNIIPEEIRTSFGIGLGSNDPEYTAYENYYPQIRAFWEAERNSSNFDIRGESGVPDIYLNIGEGNIPNSSDGNIQRASPEVEQRTVPEYVSTPKRQLAKKRNWQKYRLLGFTLNREGLTEEEYNLYLQFKKMMLESWDDESRRLGLKPGKKKNYDEEEV